MPLALRAAMQVLDAASPSTAARVAAGLFTRPRSAPAVPHAPPLVARRFSLPSAGSTLAVWEWGEGPTVLLVHGWNGNAAQMAPFVAPLVRAGYYVAALDLPAHGASTGRAATVKTFADAIGDAGRRLGPVHAVVAHSLGGTAAAIALSRGLRARRAVFLASPAEMPHYARRFCSALGLSFRTTEEMIARVFALAGGAASIDVPTLAATQSARLLALHDPEDREVRYEDSERIARAWPGARLESMPGRGHVRLLRDFEVIERVLEFVKE